ncbi:purine-cytosine permease family protein [Rummeliibacillus pycnus]|uniref:purine-cytosine permease family protein n=1 Tax=Rummeliibacillus pycnus TaxID=101070 RepID=UPI0037C6817F
MSKENSNIADDVALGYLPTDKRGKIFGLWDLILVQVVIGFSAFGLLTGAYTGSMLNAKDSIAVILFGNAFPMFLIAPIVLLFARYGIDTFIGFRSSLGYLGATLFFLLFLCLTLGYISVALFMSGQTLVELATWLGLPKFFIDSTTGTPFFAIFLFFIAFIIAAKGPIAIKKFNLLAVPSFLVFLAGLLGILIFSSHIPAISSLIPSEPFDIKSQSFMTALEINIGMGFSWLPYLGQYARLAKTGAGAYKASFYSYGIIVCLAALVGALATLVIGSIDPSTWMFPIGGSYLGVAGLLLLTVANVGAVIFLMYSQAISFKTMFPSNSWKFSMGTTIPAILLLISPTFYNAFGSFMSFISFVMASLGGIIISDYFFVKKQKISLRELYNLKGDYNYYKGVNPSAVIAISMSTIVYWSLYNPLTMESSKLFLHLSAGLPTYFVALVTYYISAKYVFKFSVDHSTVLPMIHPTKDH